MSELRYSIKSVEPGVVEVRMHRLTYLLKAKEKSSFELTALQGDAVIEHVARRDRGNVVEIDVTGRNRRRMKWKSTFGSAATRTEVLLGGKRYRIRSAPDKHGVELARSLGKLIGPDARYVGWFMKDLRQRRAFRQDLRGRLPGLGVLNGGPGTLACIAACACCGFAPIDGPLAPPCCVACYVCMLE